MKAPTFSRFSGWIALAAVVLFTVPAQALMIAVYTREGEPMKLEEMKAFALAVKEDPDQVHESFSHKISDKSVLSSKFTVPSGVSAFFWSDETFTRNGYKMGGDAAHYEADIPSEGVLAKEAIDDVAPERIFATALRQASVMSGTLRLDYSVAGSGRVVVETIGINGQRFGRWNISEVAAGEYRRSFGLNRVTKGPFFVRWTHGNVQVVQKVNPLVSKE